MALIDFVFTRAGEATRTAQNGLLATVPSNFPVVNFDDGDLLGYYSQRAATNLLQRSEEFDNAYWTNAASGTGINPARTANVAIAPDGTQTADRVFFDQGAGVASGDFSALRSANISTTVQSYTGSIWLKADTVDDIGKQLLIRHAGGAQYGVFTLTADWQRVNRTETGILGNIPFEIGVRTQQGGNAPQVSTLLWGAQLETGSVATSYIKTVDTTVTRNKDIATASALTLSPLSNVQFKANFPTNYPLVIAGLQATVSGYRTIRLELSPTEKTLFVDGVEADTDTGSYDWSGITSIELGHFDGGEQPNFEIADLRINE
jgi:hypothetical protein